MSTAAYETGQLCPLVHLPLQEYVLTKSRVTTTSSSWQCELTVLLRVGLSIQPSSRWCTTQVSCFFIGACYTKIALWRCHILKPSLPYSISYMRLMPTTEGICLLFRGGLRWRLLRYMILSTAAGFGIGFWRLLIIIAIALLSVRHWTGPDAAVIQGIQVISLGICAEIARSECIYFSIITKQPVCGIILVILGAADSILEVLQQNASTLFQIQDNLRVNGHFEGSKNWAKNRAGVMKNLRNANSRYNCSGFS